MLKRLGDLPLKQVFGLIGMLGLLAVGLSNGCQGDQACGESSECGNGLICNADGICADSCETNDECGVTEACVEGGCVATQQHVGMDPWLVLLLIGFALIGAPLFAIFGAASMILFGGSDGGTITSVAVDVFSERFADSPTLVTLPLFTFAGYLMAESGTPQRLVRVSRGLFGWLPGGLAVVCLVASAFFTTFTGGSGITIVAVGGLLFPALIQEKYPEQFSLGLVTTGGSLGLLFPPSIPIVLYAVVAGILIDKLFVAGLLPGGVTVAILIGYAVVIGWLQKPDPEKMKSGFLMFLRFVGGYVGGALLTLLVLVGIGMATGIGAPEDGSSWLSANGRYLLLPVTLVAFFTGTFATAGETKAALLETSWEILLPNVLIAGLATGVLRIHEAAAFTALYVLIVEIWVYRDISITKDLPRVIKDSMTMLGAILAILATALGFTGYLIQARVPELMVEWMETFITHPLMFLLALNIFLLVVGMLMDIFSAIVVVVPLIVPIALHFGIDPYHLGIIFLLNLEIGYLTPPVGLNLFIASFRFDKPVTQLYTAVLPFIGFLVIALLVTTYWEPLSTWLPSFMDTDELTTEEIENMGDDGAATEMGGGDDLLGDDGMGGGGLDDLDSLDDLDDIDLDDLDLDDLEGGGDPDSLDLDDLEDDLDDLPGLEEDPPSPEEETLDDILDD